MSDADRPINARSIVADFGRRLGGQPQLYRAPARVNIIGEHTDYNDGFVLPTTTALYTWIAIAKRADRVLRVYSSRFEQMVSLDLDQLTRGTDEQWCEYVKGVAWSLQRAGHTLGGAEVLIDTKIPIGSGLSSSASLEVALAYALLDCAGVHLEPDLLAQLCQQAEVEFVGVNCGIMDQYAIACNDLDQAIMLDCRNLRCESIPLLQGAELLIADSGVRHRLPAGQFNSRGEEIAQALTRLNSRFPHLESLRDFSMTQLKANQDLLEKRPFRRCRHVLTEIERVLDAMTALQEQDPARLGNAMSACHASLRDDYEVSCRELDQLVGIAMNCQGVYGSRMMGAGFGGCTISLVATSCLDQVIQSLEREYTQSSGKPTWTHIVTPTRAVHSLAHEKPDLPSAVQNHP